MSVNAQNGYNQVRRATATSSSIEQQILVSLAAEMEAADLTTPSGFSQLVSAISRNSELWTAFATDIAGDGNQLDENLRVELLKIAAFSLKQGSKIMQGEGSPDALISINRAIAAGLRTTAGGAS